MNVVMEQETMTLDAWWNETDFPAKDLFRLKENGELALLPVEHNEERVISSLTPENAAHTLKALVEKFPEVEARMKELETEWAAAEDKLKLIGKVERVKEYLNHAHAVGDFKSLYKRIGEMDDFIIKQADVNYEAKLKIAELAEKLASSDNWKEATEAFKHITEEWKNSGYTDRKRNDELWNRIEAARNKFFDRKRANKEETEQEMLRNLDLKMELVEKAEAVAVSESWKKTSEEYHNLMEEWKKVGHISPEKNKELWTRFINARNTFFESKKKHFDEIHTEQEANYAAKLALVEKAEALQDSTEWNNTTQAYTELDEAWRKIGRAPAEKSDEVWNRFNAAKDKFFHARREHFATMKVSLDDNLAQKMALLKRAETLQHSSQWHEATGEMNELMVEWKKIGAVPREQSKDIWDRFIAARKNFFDRKDAHREQHKKRIEEHQNYRKQQAGSFQKRLEDELKEEEEKLADFKNGIQNITPGKKAEELRQHLENLIKETEEKIERKKAKLGSMQHEVQQLEKPARKEKEKGKKKKAEKPEAAIGEAKEQPAETEDITAEGTTAIENTAAPEDKTEEQVQSETAE